MAKIYLVSAGEYSDYSVHEAFSTREKAEDYAALENKKLQKSFHYVHDMYFVEEYEIDRVGTEPQDKYTAYNILMDKDGTIRDIYERELCGHTPATYNLVVHMFRFPQISVACTAKSKEQAIKIANDLRAQSIANNEWAR